MVCATPDIAVPVIPAQGTVVFVHPYFLTFDDIWKRIYMKPSIKSKMSSPLTQGEAVPVDGVDAVNKSSQFIPLYHLRVCPCLFAEIQ